MEGTAHLVTEKRSAILENGVLERITQKIFLFFKFFGF
jgi:hypothetical protein